LPLYVAFLLLQLGSCFLVCRLQITQLQEKMLQQQKQQQLVLATGSAELSRIEDECKDHIQLTRAEMVKKLAKVAADHELEIKRLVR
jgi:hypothetical protein